MERIGLNFLKFNQAMTESMMCGIPKDPEKVKEWTGDSDEATLLSFRLVNASGG